jgi:hypothetical protein
MASQCAVNVRQLASMLQTHGGMAPNEHAAQYLSSWTGPKSDYATLLFPLSELSGRPELYKGTFHCVANVLGRGGLATRTGRNSRRRWCPRCYLEWDDERSYEPLLWAFSMLAACPVHGVLLEGECAWCGVEQRYQRLYGVRRDCIACKRPLGHKGISADLRDTQHWIDASLHKFAQFITSLEEQVEWTSYETFITGLADRLRNGEQIPPAIRQYIHGRVRLHGKEIGVLPTISQYLNMCAFQGCEIEEILTTPEVAAAKPLFDRGDGFTRLPFARRVIAGNLQEIGFCMDAMLSNATLRLPPVGLLYREFGLWGDVVRDNFADLQRRYLDRFEAQAGQFQRAYERRAFESALHLSRSNPDWRGEDDGVMKLSNAVAAATKLSTDLVQSCSFSAIAFRSIREAFEPGNLARREISSWDRYIVGASA